MAGNEELMAAAARGDQRAWEVLVQRHNGLLRSVARGYRLDTADVIQTTWLRLVENLGRIKDPERLGGWLASRVLMVSPPVPYVEIAELLEMPIGSIGPARGRCLGQLRRIARIP